MPSPPLATRVSPMGRTVRMRKELGVLVLLLAAETVCASASDSARRRTLISIGDGNVVGSIVPSATLVKDAPFASETSSTAGGDTESSGRGSPVPFSAEGDAADTSATVDSSSAAAVVLDVAIISIAMSHLPWKEVIRLRGVCRRWFSASSSVAVLCRLPHTHSNSGALAAFIPCHEDLDANEMDDERELTCDHGTSWRCATCAFWNAPSRIMCGNRRCQAPASTHRDAARMFLGQLRRSGTVPFIKWLAACVLDAPRAVINVENHRHKVTGRGKGCAWVYISNTRAAADLLQYHRRMYLDIVGGVEGVWIVRPEDVSSLDATVAAHSASSARPRHLPRNSLVVEHPSAMNPACLAVPSSTPEVADAAMSAEWGIGAATAPRMGHSAPFVTVGHHPGYLHNYCGGWNPLVLQPQEMAPPPYFWETEGAYGGAHHVSVAPSYPYSSTQYGQPRCHQPYTTPGAALAGGPYPRGVYTHATCL